MYGGTNVVRQAVLISFRCFCVVSLRSRAPGESPSTCDFHKTIRVRFSYAYGRDSLLFIQQLTLLLTPLLLVLRALQLLLFLVM
jgi:hypothetical protein